MNIAVKTYFLPIPAALIINSGKHTTQDIVTAGQPNIRSDSAQALQPIQQQLNMALARKRTLNNIPIEQIIAPSIYHLDIT